MLEKNNQVVKYQPADDVRTTLLQLCFGVVTTSKQRLFNVMSVGMNLEVKSTEKINNFFINIF